jgi:hypothetical protein
MKDQNQAPDRRAKITKNLKFAFVVAAALSIFVGALWLAPYVASLALNSFLGKTLMFLMLTATYIVVFILVVSACRFTRDRWSGQKNLTFAQACREECQTFGEKVVDQDGIDKNNNRRWGYLAAMTLITFVIALDHLGAPLLWSGVGKIPSDLVSPAGRQSISSGWTYFMYGNYPPKIAPAPVLPIGPTWFWWQAFTMYVALTVVYFFIAFWDESCAAFTKGWGIFKERFKEHHEKMAAQKAAESEGKSKESAEKEKTVTTKTEVKSQTPPATASVTTETAPGNTGVISNVTLNPPPESKGSSFGWGSFFSASLVAEIAAGMLHEFLEHRDHRLKGATP